MPQAKTKPCKRCEQDMPARRKTCPNCAQHQEHPTVPMGVRVFSTYCEGEWAENNDGTSRQHVLAKMRPGDTVLLQRDPRNPHDENAIRTMKKGGLFSGAKQFGFLPRGTAAEVSPRMAQGYTYIAALIRLTGNPGYDRGAQIFVLEVEPGTKPNEGLRFFQQQLREEVRIGKERRKRPA